MKIAILTLWLMALTAYTLFNSFNTWHSISDIANHIVDAHTAQRDELHSVLSQYRKELREAYETPEDER